jgi:hypothetical protein
VPPLGVLALVLVASLTGSVEFGVVGVCLTAHGALLLLELVLLKVRLRELILELADLVVGGAEVGVEYLELLIPASLLKLQHL